MKWENQRFLQYSAENCIKGNFWGMESDKIVMINFLNHIGLGLSEKLSKQLFSMQYVTLVGPGVDPFQARSNHHVERICLISDFKCFLIKFGKYVNKIHLMQMCVSFQRQNHKTLIHMWIFVIPLPYFTQLSLPKLKSQPRIKLFF